MKNSIKNLLGILGSLVLIGVLVFLSQGSSKNLFGSVVGGNEYNATTTRNYAGTSMSNPALIKSGYGTLGSVVITGAGAGVINFYDNTSTSTTATTTLASIPASTAAGTYILDVAFTRGLLVEIVGTAPTSTITYR